MKKVKGEGRKAKGKREKRRLFLTVASCLLPLAFLWACTVDERRAGLPLEAQAVIDAVTERIAQERLDEIYSEAADEWRGAATPEQSRQALERGRAALGGVVSRAFVSGKDQQGTGDEPHTLVVVYNTQFERANGMETFTLIERGGRWQLARYFVNSDALRP